VGELAEPPARMARGPGGPDRLGIVVTELTPELVRCLGLPPTIHGVVVERLAAGGLGQRAGLRPGNVIQEVNDKPIDSAREFAQTVEQTGGNDLVLLVNRAGSIACLVIERGSPG
jgi:serine protease Do